MATLRINPRANTEKANPPAVEHREVSDKAVPGLSKAQENTAYDDTSVVEIDPVSMTFDLDM